MPSTNFAFRYRYPLLARRRVAHGVARKGHSDNNHVTKQQTNKHLIIKQGKENSRSGVKRIAINTPCFSHRYLLLDRRQVTQVVEKGTHGQQTRMKATHKETSHE